MFGLGMGELVIILVVVLLLFGAKKVPQLGEGLGKAIKGFKQGIKEEDDKEKIESSKQE
jgi:sec-independent protein translocase protein TatA